MQFELFDCVKEANLFHAVNLDSERFLLQNLKTTTSWGFQTTAFTTE